MDYMLKRWTSFTRFLADGRICLSNNAAERSLRGIALGRRGSLFAGSERAAIMYTLIQTAKLNDVDPQVWLAGVLARIAGSLAADRLLIDPKRPQKGVYLANMTSRQEFCCVLC
jgi:transposase